MIPKIIHYCWFGKKKKSKLVNRCIDSWRKRCPDYKIIEWNEENFDVTENVFCKEAYDAKKWAFVSDYVRLKVIYEYGGIYLDTDVELIKKMDELLNNGIFLAFERNNKINTGLGFGATKNNRIIKKNLDYYSERHFKIGDNKYDQTPCPIIMTKILHEQLLQIKNTDSVYRHNGLCILPTDYFCPYDSELKVLNITNNTIGIHWYNASWNDHRTFKIAKNAISSVAKRVIGKEKVNKIKAIISHGQNRKKH